MASADSLHIFFKLSFEKLLRVWCADGMHHCVMGRNRAILMILQPAGQTGQAEANMSDQTTIACYRSRTGYAPIDAVRYGRLAMVQPHHHQETDLLLYHMSGAKGAKGMNEAIRGADEPDLFYLSHGTGVAGGGKVAGTPFAIKPHYDVRTTFTPCGADASATFAASASSSNLMFPNGYLASLLEDRRRQCFRSILYTPDEVLVQLFRILEAEIIQPGFATRLMVEGLSRAIAARLVGLDRAVFDLEAERIHLPEWKLRRVLEFIEAHLGQDITLTDLAAVAGLSVFHFARVFKRAKGTTPYQYVYYRRIGRSRELLADSDLDVSQVALACGFASQSHFTAAFSKAAGISPARFRRQNRM